MQPDQPVRFRVRLGTIAALDAVHFEEEVVEVGDCGSFVGPHPNPRLPGWLVVAVRVNERDLLVPCVEGQVEAIELEDVALGARLDAAVEKLEAEAVAEREANR